MDPRPPNDPHGNSSTRANAKENPRGRNHRRLGDRSRGPQLNHNGEMEVLGDVREQDFVVALFLMGVASFLLREVCTC